MLSLCVQFCLTILTISPVQYHSGLGGAILVTRENIQVYRGGRLLVGFKTTETHKALFRQDKAGNTVSGMTQVQYTSNTNVFQAVYQAQSSK